MSLGESQARTYAAPHPFWQGNGDFTSLSAGSAPRRMILADETAG